MSEAKQSPVIYTKFEKARIVGARALQISMGAPFIIPLKEADLEELKYDPIKIAIREYDKGVIPMGIRRPAPGSLIRSKILTQKKEAAALNKQ